jgi:4'-phosphopantetheinyl transferase
MSHSLYWLSLTLADVPDDDAWLSTAERTQLAGFRFSKRRREWRLGRWTAKQAISLYLGWKFDPLTLSKLEIRPAPDGAPEAFIDGHAAPASLSISHSKGRSFCAVGGRATGVGCDLEWIEPREESLVADYFTAEERARVARTPFSERSLVITLIWCAKESVLKSLRHGLRRDTRSVVVFLPEAENKDAWNSFTVRCLESSGTFHGWWRVSAGFIETVTSIVAAAQPIGLTTPQRRSAAGSRNQIGRFSP